MSVPERRVNKVDLSFVIPAYNEEETLPVVLRSIRQCVPDVCSYEIIVADNGSSDETAVVAKVANARVFVEKDVTVSGLRNRGASIANGAVLIFLDADVVLTRDWGINIAAVVQELHENPDMVTGSWYGVPESPNWIERYWYKPLLKGRNTHINGGHLIIDRGVFDRLGGFDDRLETGEDYEFSMRAKRAGLKVIEDTRLNVVHLGYPQSLVEFVEREVWHGRGDCSSVSSVLGSKVALVSIGFLVAHVGLLLNVLFSGNAYVSAGFLFFICAAPVGAATYKYIEDPVPTILINGVLYYFYFVARSISLVTKWIHSAPVKLTRSRRSLCGKSE